MKRETAEAKIRRSGTNISRFPEKPKNVSAQTGDTKQASAVPGKSGLDEMATDLDHVFHAALARAYGGLSPLALGQAWRDWASHLAISPGEQIKLAHRAAEEAENLFRRLGQSPMQPDVAEFAVNRTSERDHRFRSAHWQDWPYSWLAESFLSVERWWDRAINDVHGATAEHKALTAFLMRQILDTWSPSNFIATNPEVIQHTREEMGANLLRGAMNAAEDTRRLIFKLKPAGTEGFVPGKTVATARGRVVHRTHLAEIIQYEPTTQQVHPEPVVIVPAWIMKYYILDLSPHNSLVQRLTDQGFTVFMVSWHNPAAEDRDVSFDDYRKEGVMAAIDAATAITGAKKVHATGYCLGGTLLTIAAAAMARDGDDRLASLTLLAAQADFEEAGELRLFINESQLAVIEHLMWERGFLDGSQMAGAFNLLRSNDLIWSKLINDYLLGQRPAMLDVMAWASDTTRLPYRMHSHYLRSLYLQNDLAEGRFRVGEKPVAVPDIRVPIFLLATEWDHIAPWKSVYKYHLLTEGELTFTLTNGGHNQGVIADPHRPGLHYRIGTRQASGQYIDPDNWRAQTPEKAGSWWIDWFEWLSRKSGPLCAPPPTGSPARNYPALEAAPGLYVFQ